MLYDFFGLKTLFDDCFSLGYFQCFSSKHKLCVLARSTIMKLLAIYVLRQKKKIEKKTVNPSSNKIQFECIEIADLACKHGKT